MENAIVVAAEPQVELAALNEQEQAELIQCEAAISDGLQSFVEVGMALLKIRDQRLYRQEYSDFNWYCRQRWGFSRIHAHRNIDAAKVHEMLPIGNRPANEAQTRPMTRIRTEDGELDQRAITRVWQRVVDNAPVDGGGRKVITAQLVEEASRPVLRRRGIRTGPTCRPRWRTSTGVSTPESEAAATDSAMSDVISNQDFMKLREHVKALAKLMVTEALPMSVRSEIEMVCDIVLV